MTYRNRAPGFRERDERRAAEFKASQRPNVRGILDMIDDVVEFGYVHGYHEHGIPLVETVRDELSSIREDLMRCGGSLRAGSAAREAMGRACARLRVLAERSEATPADPSIAAERGREQADR